MSAASQNAESSIHPTAPGRAGAFPAGPGQHPHGGPGLLHPASDTTTHRQTADGEFPGGVVCAVVESYVSLNMMRQSLMEQASAKRKS
ncbi:hypothetical protein AWENTII_009518 [Aspergillus wentii]